MSAPQNLPATVRSEGAGGAKGAVKQYLAKNVNHLAGLLPPGMDEKRMARIAMEAFRELPALQSCTPASLIGGILAAAQVGLPIGKASGGYAYLIPFGSEATFVVGVPGRIRLAYQSGHVKAARSGIVYADQSFDVDEVAGDIIIGMKNPEKNYEAEEGQWFWAAVETTSGGRIVDYMNRATVEARRAKLKSKNSPAWRDHFSEMAQNMVLRRLLKRIPKSESQMRAEVMDSRVIRHDDGSLVAEWVDTEDRDDDKVLDVTPEPVPEKKRKPRKKKSSPSEPGTALRVEVYMRENNIAPKDANPALRKAGLIDQDGSWTTVADDADWQRAKEALDSVAGR